MQVAIEPVGERKLVANSELLEGSRAEIFQQLVDWIDELELLDEEDEEQVSEWERMVTVELAIQFINNWCDEWSARIVTS